MHPAYTGPHCALPLPFRCPQNRLRMLRGLGLGNPQLARLLQDAPDLLELPPVAGQVRSYGLPCARVPHTCVRASLLPAAAAAAAAVDVLMRNNTCVFTPPHPAPHLTPT